MMAGRIMGRTLSAKETAALLGISTITLKRWLTSGNPDLYIPHWKSGLRGDYKFDEDEVRRWKEAQKHHSGIMHPVLA